MSPKASLRPIVTSVLAALWFALVLGTSAHAQQLVLARASNPDTPDMLAPAPPPAQVPLAGTAIPKYVDPLPTFPFRVDGTKALTVTMDEFQQQVLPASIYAPLLAPFNQGTFVWGYMIEEAGGVTAPLHYPAFTVVAQRDVPTQITYYNNLVNPFLQRYPANATPIFAVDQTLNWADPLNQGVQFTPYTGPVPACVHIHGGDVPSAYDGGPDAWFTPNTPGNSPITGPGYVTNVYRYPNASDACTVWFHDHALGITRLTPHMGMAAFYLIRDPAREPTNLPSGTYDQEIAIQDRFFDTNGQMIFPALGINPTVHPFWIPEFFGDTIVVNGKSWPYFNVEPRRYRLRLLNGSNARVYEMTFFDKTTNTRLPFWQIATDQGYLDAPAMITMLRLAPGERAEIVVDFTGLPGRTFLLDNSAKAPFPGGAPPDPQTVGQIMQFRVTLPLNGTDTTCNPATAGACVLRPTNPIVRLNPLPANVPTRRLTLNEVAGPGGPLVIMLNNSELRKLGDLGSVTETPQVGATEIWEFVNLTADLHPIHTHLFAFQVLSRQTLQANKYAKAYAAAFPGGFNPADGLNYLPGVYMPGFGPPLAYGNCLPGTVCGGNPDPTPYLQMAPVPPPASEAGWKDTVQVMPGQVTRIAVRLAPKDVAIGDVSPGVNKYPFDPTAKLGTVDAFGYPGGPGYVWHCHIIDHEDNEMMRRYEVSK